MHRKERQKPNRANAQPRETHIDHKGDRQTAPSYPVRRRLASPSLQPIHDTDRRVRNLTNPTPKHPGYRKSAKAGKRSKIKVTP
jgi:hypothetical protein